jgi:hypothetical protein
MVSGKKILLFSEKWKNSVFFSIHNIINDRIFLLIANLARSTSRPLSYERECRTMQGRCAPW